MFISDEPGTLMHIPNILVIVIILFGMLYFTSDASRKLKLMYDTLTTSTSKILDPSDPIYKMTQPLSTYLIELDYHFNPGSYVNLTSDLEFLGSSCLWLMMDVKTLLPQEMKKIYR